VKSSMKCFNVEIARIDFLFSNPSQKLERDGRDVRMIGMVGMVEVVGMVGMVGM
jgi:hypothetical protein